MPVADQREDRLRLRVRGGEPGYVDPFAIPAFFACERHERSGAGLAVQDAIALSGVRPERPFSVGRRQRLAGVNARIVERDARDVIVGRGRLAGGQCDKSEADRVAWRHRVSARG